MEAVSSAKLQNAPLIRSLRSLAAMRAENNWRVGASQPGGVNGPILYVVVIRIGDPHCRYRLARSRSPTIVLVIGRAGASPPSRFAGGICHPRDTYTVPAGPGPVLRANVKPARSHPVTWVRRTIYGMSRTSRRFTSKPCLVCCDSRFGLPLSLTSSTLRAQLPFAASFHAACCVRSRITFSRQFLRKL